MIHKASLLFCAAAFVCTASLAGAQSATPPTALSKILSRVDLGIVGAGEFTHNVSGPIIPHEAPDFGSTLVEQASNTFGAVVTLRYQHRPWIGFEGNATYARYTENFISAPPNQVQTRASEYTLGYVAQPSFTVFNLSPYFGGGAGTIEFKPTGLGGNGQQTQGRLAIYYSGGVKKDVNSFLGVSAGIRQVFFMAPDFHANYLEIQKRTFTLQPTVGFYLRF